MRDFRVVVLSLLGLVCMYLTFSIDWLFIVPAVASSWWGWKLLSGREKRKV